MATSEKSKENEFSRRQILKLAGYGAMGVLAGNLWPGVDLSAASQKKSSNNDSAFVPDLDISLTARPAQVSIFPGEPTQVWQYHAAVHTGNQDRVMRIPQSYLGPIIKAHQGEKVRIRFINDIPQESIVHWHGLHVPATMDGHPRYVVKRGNSYLYEFQVKNRAGTYWYHPHPHGSTGPQVYGGLAGLFLVSDDEEPSAGLPSNEFDIPLVIQDRTFDRENQLIYTTGHPMEQMTGFLGDAVMVNGRPEFTLSVSTSTYRLRILNGSNSRIYCLAWNNDRPLTVIGNDGGLLEKPVKRPYVFLGPGERLEIWADFSSDPVGSETALISLPFSAETMGRGMMGRGMMNRQALPNGAGLSIIKINVTKGEENALALPEKLSVLEPVRQEEAVNVADPKKFFLTMNHMQWSINGRTFEIEGVADDEIVRLGSKEIWEFHNTGGGMMNMPHPIHLHGKQFRVIERGGVRHEGYVDEGWKDTVLLMPGESIRIMVDFEDYPGLYLYHCHNLEHEDMGMMRNYYVKA